MASRVPNHDFRQLGISEHPTTVVMVSQSQGPISGSISANRGVSTSPPISVPVVVSNSLVPPLSNIFVPAGLLTQPVAPSTVTAHLPIISQPAQKYCSPILFRRHYSTFPPKTYYS